MTASRHFGHRMYEIRLDVRLLYESHISIYSYLALEALARPDPHRPTLEYIQYSYLDARTLSMVIEDSSSSYPNPIPIDNDCSLKIDELLGLHSRNVSLKREPFWPHVATVLLNVHIHAEDRKCWQQWVAQSFFREPKWSQEILSEADWKHWVWDTFVVNNYERRRWKNKTQAGATAIDWDSLPPTIRKAFIMVPHDDQYRRFSNPGGVAAPL